MAKNNKESIGDDEIISATIIIPGPRTPFSEIPDVGIANDEDAYRLYLNHSLIQERLVHGASPHRLTAESYTHRAAALHPKVQKNLRNYQYTSHSEQAGVQLFWCTSIGKHFFSILAEANIPLVGDDTFEVALWINVKQAAIEIATTLEEAVAIAAHSLGDESLEPTSSAHENQWNVVAEGLLVATIFRMDTKNYRYLAQWDREIKKGH